MYAISLYRGWWAVTLNILFNSSLEIVNRTTLVHMGRLELPPSIRAFKTPDFTFCPHGQI